MNKTISINLYGSVFSIEEDAYQKLKIYLEGLKSYFSTDADHLEIMTDIESRIAEKFNAALAQQAKAVVEMSDVDNLIQEIGTPEQFQHFETADDSNFEDEPHQYQAKANNYQRTLYRDSDQKMLGGVCAGIAQYLDIDITLVRVLTLATFIFAGVGFIPYIILWVVLPEGKRDQYIKGERTVNNSDFKTKLYRNNEDKVVAGVSSGVAAYLGLEPTIVRLLFVLATIWGGFGIILYVILWIAMPKARTLFDKAAMHGQEPNLANIENLKKNKTLGNNRPQPYGQNFSKILAMPMGIIEGVIKIIGTFFQAFLGFFRIIFGVALTFLGGGIMIALVVLLAIGLAVLLGANVGDIPFNLRGITGSQANDMVSVFSGFAIVAIPAIMMIHLGIKALLRKNIFNSRILLGMMITWFVSVGVASFAATAVAHNFKQEAQIENKYDLQLPVNDLIIRQIQLDDKISCKFELQQSTTGAAYITITKEANGASKEEARASAAELQYFYELKDSLLLLNGGFYIPETSTFRNQKIRVVCYLPKGKNFGLSNSLYYDLYNRNEIDPNNFLEDNENKRYSFENGVITCKDCTADEFFQGQNLSIDDAHYRDITISGKINVEIYSGEEQRIYTEGIDLEDLEIEERGRKISIAVKNGNSNANGKLYINSSTIDFINVSDGVNVKINNLNSNSLGLDANNAKINLDQVDINNLEIRASGNTVITASGNCDSFNLDLSNDAYVDAEQLKTASANINSSDNAEALIKALEKLNVSASNKSSITLYGKPENSVLKTLDNAQIKKSDNF